MSSHGYPPARRCRFHLEDGNGLYWTVNKNRFKWSVQSYNGWPINELIEIQPMFGICKEVLLRIRGPP